MGWSSFVPSRTLNESGFSILGLSAIDLLVSVCVFGFLQPILHLILSLSLIWPLIITVIQVTFMIHVRRKHRRHYLRDLALHLYLKIMKGGSYYDPTVDRPKNT